MRVVSNIHVFYEIARDAHAKSLDSLNRHRTPNDRGGYTLTQDPERTSFKTALISIAFAGAYIELHLKFAFIAKSGKSPSRNWDRQKYEEKLRSLGVSDELLLERVGKFRIGRNDVLHEQPIVIGEPSTGLPGTAQDLSVFGMSLVEELRKVLPIGSAHSTEI